MWGRGGHNQDFNQPAGGIPVLRHQDAPAPPPPPAAGGLGPVPPPSSYYGGYPQGPPPGLGFEPPPSYTYSQPPAAGAVPYPSVYPYQQQPQGATGDEEWLSVTHGATFPFGARLVQAMDRPLYNNDRTAKECFVTMWTKNNEPVFGRAWNNNGKVEAWFPHGGKEHHSASLSSPFHLLTYYGPPRQNFRYAWVPVEQLNPMCQPVRRGDYSPAVLMGLRVGSFDGEMLGKCSLTQKMAWISYDGKEHHFDRDKFNKTNVLCRVPL